MHKHSKLERLLQSAYTRQQQIQASSAMSQSPPPHEVHWLHDVFASPQFWGVVSMVALAVAFSPKVNGGATWLCLLLAIAAACSMVWNLKRVMDSPHRRKLTAGTLILASALALPFGSWLTKLDYKKPENSQTSPLTMKIEIVPPIAVFAKCDMMGLPIEIPPQDMIRVVPVNKRGMKSSNWGSFEIRNDSKKAEQWPNKAKIKESERLKNLGVFAYRCEVSNHASSNLFDVAMPMRFWFGDKGGEENAVKYTPVISPLDAGHSFVLYFVNECPIVANAIISDYVTVIVAGETTRRNAKLNLPNRNPADPIMFWLPTKISWVNWAQCE